MAAKIKKGDNVVITTGRDKGKTGEVIQVMPKEERALVRGVNLVKRHTRQSMNQEGGIISKEAPIHLSNLAYADQDGKATRVGFTRSIASVILRVVGASSTSPGWKIEYWLSGERSSSPGRTSRISRSPRSQPCPAAEARSSASGSFRVT